jgi:hypothetical protein
MAAAAPTRPSRPAGISVGRAKLDELDFGEAAAAVGPELLDAALAVLVWAAATEVETALEADADADTEFETARCMPPMACPPAAAPVTSMPTLSQSWVAAV